MTNPLQESRKEHVLVCAHRGTGGASIIQNTRLAFNNALLHGADIVELDIVRSKDGIFYGLHDGVEKYIFGKEVDIRELNSDEIDALVVTNEFDKPLEGHVERVDVILDYLAGKDCFINLDRSWF